MYGSGINDCGRNGDRLGLKILNGLVDFKLDRLALSLRLKPKSLTEGRLGDFIKKFKKRLA
jgi:hypothetical protein